MLLAGDIGGTKTDLAVYSGEAGPYAPSPRQKCIAPTTAAWRQLRGSF